MSNDTALVVRSFIERRAQLDTTWCWLDRHGERHAPDQMETRHLFNTLKMIWNNMVPSQYRVGYNVRLYSFGPSYTRQYMVAAVYHIGHQLAKRTLTAEQMQILRQMQAYFTGVGMLT
jgi:hypothetical protein